MGAYFFKNRNGFLRGCIFLVLILCALGSGEFLPGIADAGGPIQTNQAVSMGISPGSVTVSPGSSGVYTLTVALPELETSRNPTLQFQATGLPTGVTPTFEFVSMNASQAVWRLTLATTPNVAVGTYGFSILGGYRAPYRKSPVVSFTGQATLQVQTQGTPAPRYIPIVTPQAPILPRNGTVGFSVDVKPLSPAFGNDTVYFWTEGLPQTISEQFVPASARVGTLIRLNLTSTEATAGKYEFRLCVSRFPRETAGNDRQFTRVVVVVAGTGSETTLRGRVMTAEQNAVPLANVTLSAATNPAMQVRTDADGYFTLRNLASVYHQIVNIDGHTADTETQTYPILPIGVDVVPGTANELPWIIYLPRIDTANNRPIVQDADFPQIITSPTVPNARIVIPPHTFITNADGSPVPQISITPVPGDRPPMPLPDGLTVQDIPKLFTIQPGGAVASRPVEVDFPNLISSAPGSEMTLWTADHDTGLFHVYGNGKTSTDGLQQLPNPDPQNSGLKYGLSRFSWHFAGLRCPERPGLGIIGIALTPVDSPFIAIGEEVKFNFFVVADNQEIRDVSDFTDFQSSRPDILAIGAGGLARAVGLPPGVTCSVAEVRATLNSAPPGFACNPNGATPSLTNFVTVSRQNNLNIRVTSPDSPVYSDAVSAAVNRTGHAFLQISGVNGVTVTVSDLTNGQQIFEQVVNGSVTVPLESEAQGTRYRITTTNECSGQINKPLILYRIPNARLNFTPDPIPLNTVGTGIDETTEPVNVITRFDLNSYMPPLASIEVQIRKDNQLVRVLGNCSQGGNCEQVIPQGFQFDRRATYDLVVEYTLAIAGAPKIIANRKRLLDPKIIIDYNDEIVHRKAIEPVTNNVCDDYSFFTGILNVPARLVIKYRYDQFSTEFTEYDGNLPSGPFQIPVPQTVTQLIGSGVFTMVATDPETQLEDTVYGTISVRKEIAGSPLPIGHTMVKGVDLTDGHLSLENNDFTIPGRGLSLEMNRTYSSAGTDESPFGRKWSFNYGAKVFEERIGPCRFISVKGGDTSFSFKQLDDGTFLPQPGFRGRLTYDDEGFHFRTKSGIQYDFRPLLGGNPALAGVLFRISDPNGNALRLSYDELGRLKFVTDASGRGITFAYSPTPIGGAFRIVSAAAPGNLLISYDYDNFGNLIRVTRGTANTRVWTYTYFQPPPANPTTTRRGIRGRASGQVCNFPDLLPSRLSVITSMSDPRGNVTSYEYYTCGDTLTGEGLQPQGCNPGLGQCQANVILDRTKYIVKRIVEPENRVWNFNFDLTNFITSKKLYAFVQNPRQFSTRYVIDTDSGVTLEMNQPLGITTKMTWSGVDRTSDTDANGRRTEYNYDQLGNIIYEAVDKGSTWSLGSNPVESFMTYDPNFSKLLSKTDPTGGQSTYQLDNRGNLISETHSPDPISLPPDQRRIFTTTYSYNPDGTVATRLDPRGFLTAYEYDPLKGGRFGKPTRIRTFIGVDQQGNQIVLNNDIQYDVRSRVIYTRDPWGRVTTTDYNDFDEPVRVLTTDTNPLTSTSSAPNLVTYEYYPTGQVRKRTEGPRETVSTIDGLNRVTVVTDTDRSVPNTPITYTSIMTYDPNGNAEEVRDRRGVTTKSYFDAIDRPYRKEISSGPFGGPSNGTGQLEQVTYDKVGNVLTKRDLHNDLTTFEYDHLYRVKTVIHPVNGADGQPYRKSFEYDAVGNLLAKIDENGHRTEMAYDRLGRLTRITDPVGRIGTMDYVADSNSIAVSKDLTSGLQTSFQYDGMFRVLGQTAVFPDVLSPGNLIVYNRSFAYDDVRHAAVETNPRGFVNETIMDGFGRVYRQTVDVGGLNLTAFFHYDDRGNRIAMTDPEGRTDGDPLRTTNSYFDGFNRMIRTVAPPVPTNFGTGTVRYEERFKYDGEGLLIENTTRRGVVKKYDFDNIGRTTGWVLLESDGSPFPKPRRMSQILYDDMIVGGEGITSSMTTIDAENRTIRSEYDAMGRTLRITDGVGAPLERTRTMAYDGVNLREQSDWLQRKTYFTYDAANRVTDRTDPLSRTIHTAYDDPNVSVSVTDPSGIVGTRTADALGRPVRMIVVGRNGETIVPFARKYDGNDNPVSETDAANNVNTWSYDGADRMTTQTLGAGSAAPTTIGQRYDRVNNLTAVTNGRLSRFFIVDALGRQLTETDGVGRVTRRLYDGHGNVVRSRDPYGDDWSYTFDELDAILSAFPSDDPISNTENAKYGYDHMRRRTSDLRNDRLVERDYDVFGRLITKRESKLLGSFVQETYQYDANDNLRVFTDRKGQEVDFDYDPADRLLSKSYPGATQGSFGPVTSRWNFSYSPTDRVLEVGEERLDGDLRYRRMTYDGLDRMASETDALGKTLSYTYLATGLRQTMRDANNDLTTYAYDGQNRPSSVTNPHGGASWTYGPDGLLTQVRQAGAGIETNYGYDQAGRVASVENRNVRTGNLFSRYGLTYDDAYNRIELNEVGPTGLAERTQFRFGRHNRLDEVRYPTHRVAYDYQGPLGVRDRETASGSVNYDRRYCYNGQFGLRLERIEESGGRQVTFEYDANGNMTRKAVLNAPNARTLSFAYDIRDRMREARNEETGESAGRYEYDDLGRRVRRESSEGVLNTTYDGDEAVNEWDGVIQTATTYVYGGAMLLGRSERTGNVWEDFGYSWNHLGSTSEVTEKGTGSVRAHYRYDAWGGLKDEEGLNQSGNRKTFTGQVYDRETGLYAMGNGTRFYDAETGGFTQEDPVYGDVTAPLTMSPYVYARNNPVWYVDPTGMTPDEKEKTTLRRGERVTVTSGGVETQGIIDSGIPLYRYFLEVFGKRGDDRLVEGGNGVGKVNQEPDPPSFGPEPEKPRRVVNRQPGRGGSRPTRAGSPGSKYGYAPVKLTDGTTVRVGTLEGRDYVGQMLATVEDGVVEGMRSFLAQGPGLVEAGVDAFYDFANGTWADRGKMFAKNLYRFSVYGIIGSKLESIKKGYDGYLAYANDPWAAHEYLLRPGRDGFLFHAVHDQTVEALNFVTSVVAGAPFMGGGGVTQLFPEGTSGLVRGVETAAVAEGEGLVATSSESVAAAESNTVAAQSEGAAQSGGFRGDLRDTIRRQDPTNVRRAEVISDIREGKLCFVAGTPIVTEAGTKAIEAIRKGDSVLSYNEQTGKTEYKTVVRTFVNHAEELVAVTIAGEAKPIEATPSHPFFVKQARGETSSGDDEPATWVSAGQLRPGDLARTATGEWKPVVSVERRAESATVYNFEVEGNHTYFVGEAGILAHNQCASEELPKLRGKGVNEIEEILSDSGFQKTHQTSTGNQTWKHADGSEVRIHPYGNQNLSQFKTANNAHVHKIDNLGNNLNDRGLVSPNPNETHIGIPNPSDLPQKRNRPHGAGVK